MDKITKKEVSTKDEIIIIIKKLSSCNRIRLLTFAKGLVKNKSNKEVNDKIN